MKRKTYIPPRSTFMPLQFESHLVGATPTTSDQFGKDTDFDDEEENNNLDSFDRNWDSDIRFRRWSDVEEQEEEEEI